MVPLHKHEKYAALAAEINELGAVHGKVNARLQSIEASLRAAELPSPEGARAAQVEAALAFAKSGQAQLPARPMIETLSEEHTALKQQESALAATIKALREQLTNLERALSAALRAKLTTAHREMALRYARKLEELQAICLEEESLFSQANAAGYDLSFPQRLQNPSIGSIYDLGSGALSYHYRDVRNYGGRD